MLVKRFKVESTSYSYEVLWSACEKNMEDAARDNGHSWVYYLSAMTMAYFSYEAFINHVLFYIAPDKEANEREIFSSPPYKGTEGKLRFICEKSKIDFPKKGENPYQAIRLLKVLRDFSAHGKTEHYENIVEIASPNDLPGVRSKFYELVTKENAEKTIPLLKEFIISINSQVREKLYCEKLALHPLQGLIGHRFASEIAS